MVIHKSCEQFFWKYFNLCFQEHDTDRQDVMISSLNDYTGIALKAEATEFDESKTMKTAKLCAAVHCGNEDNPKSTDIFFEILA